MAAAVALPTLPAPPKITILLLDDADADDDGVSVPALVVVECGMCSLPLMPARPDDLIWVLACALRHLSPIILPRVVLDPDLVALADPILAKPYILALLTQQMRASKPEKGSSDLVT